ncbi:Helix-turn-helix domain [Mycobacteroides abscessus subsp. massiliense]|uniref:helix-turn-helix transcriptional regulator n=1 Tax=Mycobacteroides abscessus TaxID=36809 RepID=UPI0009CDFDDB|nr:helix-turn-helix domain-containing protein [Mycobacteroides abscessus]SKY52275.1 Helix-turn-helix domain [Mycobacteroides abscessus subsp. massiliense]SKZ09404.1 Helix-turn-helix domain [Mycobacteroides abscessus subsp. massiliense]
MSADAVTVSPALLCPHCRALHAPVEPPDRMTTAEAAKYTGLADATLRAYRHTGTGPVSYRLGAKVFYDRADLDKWIASQRAVSVRGGAE